MNKPRWWLWPTILSLDAPVVALLWQAMIARSAGVALGSPARLVLGFSVWLAYSADRWIEGFRLKPEQVRTHRHRFYIRWRWELFALWVSVLVLDVAVSIHSLSPEAFRNGLLLLLPVTAYLLSHQLLHRSSRWRVPKEACTALLLAGGATIFVVPPAGPSIVHIALPVVLFILLCFCNCALISVWENEVDVSHGQTSLALQYFAARRISRMLPWVLALSSAVAWALARPAAAQAAACAAVSATLLGAVDVLERRTGRAMARVLADVVLMTPVVPLLLLPGGPR
ncbi:MAG TPA: hypothetical protein VFE25_02110 [Opitutaceae bacterium]|nr:hypothetical protein [Opitutaceae bacterium]